MNKKGQEELIFGLIVFILLVAFATGAMWFSKVQNDRLQTTNCNNLEKNGYNVRMETAELLGFDKLDCFVENSPGKYVPYDRFRGTE